jgi:hypothetical protein
MEGCKNLSPPDYIWFVPHQLFWNARDEAYQKGTLLMAMTIG